MQNSIHQCNILVVEDSLMNRSLIKNFLKSDGFSSIIEAGDGLEALAKISMTPPDLIILDLLMPRMGGLELIHHLKSNPHTSRIPIIVETATLNGMERLQAWNLGATDVITKPIERMELISRVHFQLKNVMMIHELELYRQQSQDDIKQALELQESLLPSPTYIAQLEKKYSIKINSLFMPSRYLSGDMWGVFEMGPKQLAIWMCDFSGKGIKAALNTFRLHTLIHDHKFYSSDPADIVEFLNNRLVDLMPVGQYATFLMGILDFEKDFFIYSSASCPHPILYNASEQTYQVGSGMGVPLGIVSNQTYPLKAIHYPLHSSVILYSDLFWDADVPKEISLLDEDLPNFMQNLKGQSMYKKIAEKINHLSSDSLKDDLTFIEITRV